MHRLLSTNDKVVILNASFLNHEIRSYEEIVEKFSLPIYSQSFQKSRSQLKATDILGHPVYDLFYEPSKREIISNHFGQTTNDRLIEDLEYLLNSPRIVNTTTKQDLIESIHRYFDPEVIDIMKKKIELDKYLKQITDETQGSNQKKMKVKSQIFKKIFKLRLDKTGSIASISRRINKPYHQVRSIINGHNEDIDNENDEFDGVEYSPDHINAVSSFCKLFLFFQQQNLTIHQMFSRMKTMDPFFTQLSRSFFYLNFVKKQGYVFVKPKLTHSLFQKEKKSECRVFTTYLISQIIRSKQFHIFYDETTVQMTKTGYSSWFHRSEPKERHIKVTNTFLKLNLITTMDSLIAFTVTFEAFNSIAVNKFILSTCNFLSLNKAKGMEVYLVLDNAPKNRSNYLKAQCEQGLFSLVMTTPTTPQHNFAESVFHYVKRRIDRREFQQGNDNHKETRYEMVDKLFDVLRHLSSETFSIARKMYLHDLKKTLK